MEQLGVELATYNKQLDSNKSAVDAMPPLSGKYELLIRTYEQCHSNLSSMQKLKQLGKLGFFRPTDQQIWNQIKLN